MRENLSILYNAFGYYMQFLPTVLEHVEAGRKCIEKDLKDHLKLFNWEHPHNYLSVESFRRTRHKIWKLIHKFNDILQQPVMVFLNQAAVLKKDKIHTWLEQKISNELDVEVSQIPVDLMQRNKERFLWYVDWKNNADFALKSMCNGGTTGIDFLHEKDLLRQSLFSEPAFHDFKTKWEESWTFLDKVCISTVEFAHLLKYEKKNLKKRRALGELLKILERSGLSRHRSVIFELECEAQQRSLFLQPSFDVLHLLQQEGDQTVTHVNANLTGDSKKLRKDKGALKWDVANNYYFRNLAIMQQIRQICLSFSKDLSLEQVNQAVSFLDHLVVIQQEQRNAAYHILEQLRKLRRHLDLLSSISSGNRRSQESCQTSEHQHFISNSASEVISSSTCSITPKQHAVLRCMWLQKHLFDSLLAMSNDVFLLLERAKNCHLRSCDILKVEADEIHALFNKFIPIFLKSKESLNEYLLCSDGAVTASLQSIPFIASKQMEQLVMLNFQIVNSFEECLHDLNRRNLPMASVEGPLLDRFENLIKMGKMMLMQGFHLAEEDDQSICEADSSFTKLSATFSGSFEETNKLVKDAFDAFRKLCLLFDGPNSLGGYSSESITLWNFLFERFMVNLHLDQIYDSMSKTIIAASNLANYMSERKPEVHFHIEICLNHLHMLLNLLLIFAESILFEYLDVHKTTTEMTNMLAHIFALLFSKGFGSVEETTDASACDGSQDASGTGMGEGEGINDVSDQIDDEAQLLGTSEKQEGMDNSNKLHSDKDKGIEMDDDFTAETFSVNEDSGDEKSEDGEDMNLESKMGETEDGNQIVDEKPWNEDEDGSPDKSVEKYESGPSVKETNSSSQELRAREDDSVKGEELGDVDNDGSDRLCEEENKPSSSSDDERNDDMKLDKNDAFEDPTGIQLNEQEKNLEDASMDEPQDSDMMEAFNSGITESDEEMREENENSSPTDHVEDNPTQNDEHPSTQGEDNGAENADMDLVDSSKDEIEPSNVPKQGADAATPVNYLHRVDSKAEPEIGWSNGNYVDNALAPMNLPSDDVPKMEITLPDSRNGLKLASDQPKAPASENADALVPRTHPNPYRSIGDAMEDWKERVKISSDSEEIQSEAPGDLEDEEADEFRFVSEAEKGTSQACGPAMSDQLEHNIKVNQSDPDESRIMKKEDDNIMDTVRETSETLHLRTSQKPLMRQQSSEELLDKVIDNDAPPEEIQGGAPSGLSGDMVLFKSSYMNESALPLDTLINDEAFSKAMDIRELSDDMNAKATVDWKTYEQTTAKLSQELAEQLRLVMEPTLASKLQGDYRTGKRINMKKVIPYIASHFRKDKIWLRRTRPNKRDYQVVVAIDDSRSMSESLCGNVAVEALVTVCRAMSQLEVGQLAVASFGEKGNIKLLHDFDQPFTGDAGVKMISSLSFKQDNTIADEPMVDLLKYLNNMLDAAVARARMPSGQNPLHQLILIIADGRFHEKENLKRQVRDVLNRRRMIAFILLDSPQESIMDLMEASFEGEGLSFTKYLNSFPFPYYIVLKNIQALPRTLGDLLRQWFELMQSMSE